MAIDGEIFRVACRVTSSAAQDLVNVWHIRAELVEAMTDELFAGGVCTSIKNKYSTADDSQANDIDPVDIRIDCVEMVAGHETIVRHLGVFPWPEGYAPSGAFDPLPWQVAALFKFTTSGVRTLARKFWPGLTVDTLNASGNIDTATLADLVDMAAYFLGMSMLDTYNGFRFVVWGKRAAAWLPFISATVDAVLSTQRRRKINVGS